MSDKLNGVFNSGFSGIIYEGKRKSTMPSYLEKLAEQEHDIQVEEIVPADLTFESNSGLTHASELSNDEARIVESRKIVAKDFKNEIESSVKNLLSEGQSPEDIEKILSRKFPLAQVKKYFEANSSTILKKYAQIANVYLNNPSYKISKQVEDILRNHQQRLKTESGFKVCTSFYDYIKKLKIFLGKKDIEDIENHLEFFTKKENSKKEASFKRDVSQEPQKEFPKHNNQAKNEKNANNIILENIYQEIKFHIKSGLLKKEVQEKLASQYNFSKLKTVFAKYSSEIDKLEKFVNRETLLKINKLKVKGNLKTTEDLQNKTCEYQEKSMKDFAFLMMMQGKSLNEIKESLKKKFEYKYAKKFIEENNRVLEKHYGQLGYIFIDSNIFDNCDLMKESFLSINHLGKNLVYCVKANKKCKGCLENKKGTCNKVNLMISNHPLVRSSRAAKRVLTKASTFVPSSYINEFTSKITNDNNMKLVSSFILGMKNALENERKNIGKKASREPDSLNTQIGFAKTESYNVNLFKKSSKSKVINDVLAGL